MPTDLIPGSVQVVLNIANRRGSAQRHAPGGGVDAVGLQLAQINGQALFQATQGGRVSVAPPRSEKRDVVAVGQFDLELPALAIVISSVRSHVESRTTWATSRSVAGLTAAKYVGGSYVLHRSVALTKTWLPGKEMVVPFDHRVPFWRSKLLKSTGLCGAASTARPHNPTRAVKVFLRSILSGKSGDDGYFVCRWVCECAAGCAESDYRRWAFQHVFI